LIGVHFEALVSSVIARSRSRARPLAHPPFAGLRTARPSRNIATPLD
jgi:hypothetical protein